jgi:hypothetical protein
MRALEAIVELGPSAAAINARVMGGSQERIPTLTMHERAMRLVKAVWADLCAGKSHAACARAHRLTVFQVKGIENIMRNGKD